MDLNVVETHRLCKSLYSLYIHNINCIIPIKIADRPINAPRTEETVDIERNEWEQYLVFNQVSGVELRGRLV